MLESQKYPNAKDITMKSLPKIGYIALYNGHPVAAGFLRRVEGRLALIDGLVSNAFMGGIIRHKGLDLILNTLIDEAKALKLEGLLGHSVDASVHKRVTELGFIQAPDRMYVLKLP